MPRKRSSSIRSCNVCILRSLHLELSENRKPQEKKKVHFCSNNIKFFLRVLNRVILSRTPKPALFINEYQCSLILPYTLNLLKTPGSLAHVEYVDPPESLEVCELSLGFWLWVL